MYGWETEDEVGGIRARKIICLIRLFILEYNGILYFEIGWLLRVTRLRFILSFSFSLSILKCSLAESLLLEIFGWKDQTPGYIATYLLAAEDRLTMHIVVMAWLNNWKDVCLGSKT